jgi:hypothetical protein
VVANAWSPAVCSRESTISNIYSYLSILRYVSLGAGGSTDLDSAFSNDSWSSCICRELPSTHTPPSNLNGIAKLYAQSRAIGILLSVIILVETCVGGFSISTASSPTTIPGPPGVKPPCGAVMGPIGWLIAFWVSISLHKHILGAEMNSQFLFCTILSPSCM